AREAVRISLRRRRLAGRGPRLRCRVHARVLRLWAKPEARVPRAARRQLARARQGHASRAGAGVRRAARRRLARTRAGGLDGLLDQGASGVLSAAASAAWCTTLSGTPRARASARQSSNSGATFRVPSGAVATFTRTVPWGVVTVRSSRGSTSLRQVA